MSLISNKVCFKKEVLNISVLKKKRPIKQEMNRLPSEIVMENDNQLTSMFVAEMQHDDISGEFSLHTSSRRCVG